MNRLFNTRYADEVEDKLMRLVDEYSKSLEKEFKAEGAFVGLNGLLFVKRAKDKMASIGLDVGGKDLHLLLAKKARTRRANVDQVGKSIPRRRADHT
ncbi:hypothetical protein [Pseudomonas fragi]|uniref:hypothetical protein n=1 Tax=Pseudomonas fragi TaxID=296 RepID=UPI001474733F|nr:hypothetical protein [Pseudomonas fragi]ELU0817112.1 hypothetical protein [Pseudomonas putida]NNB36956.1 hypothetical protein [Pseudomonas fragi]